MGVDVPHGPSNSAALSSGRGRISNPSQQTIGVWSFTTMLGGKRTKSTRFQLMDFPWWFPTTARTYGAAILWIWTSNFSSCKLQQLCVVNKWFGCGSCSMQTKWHHQPHHSQHSEILAHVQLQTTLRSAGEDVTLIKQLWVCHSPLWNVAWWKELLNIHECPWVALHMIWYYLRDNICNTCVQSNII